MMKREELATYQGVVAVGGDGFFQVGFEPAIYIPPWHRVSNNNR